MKFRGGWLGTRTGSSEVERDPTNASTTATDAEAPSAHQGSVSTPVDEKTQGPVTAGNESDEETKKSLQYGVQVAEATLKVWTKKHLIAAYIL